MTHLSEHDLDAIEARIRDCKTYNFGLWNADKLAHEDAPAMLNELRHLRVIASGNQGAIVNSIIERTRHEPTDDEREAQANRYIAGHGDSQTRRDFLAGWDAALRRSEVPEPSAEATLSEVRSHAERWANRPPTSPYAMGLRDAWRTILRKIDGIPSGSEVPEQSAEERIEQAIAYIRASWVGLGEPTPNTPAGAIIEILEGELSFARPQGEPSSEAPEPSVEEWAERIRTARAKAIAKGYTPEHDAEHGVRHLLNWAIDYARRGRPEDSSGLILSALTLLDAEPQGEPSDAQVLQAFEDEWYRLDGVTEPERHRRTLTTALRAAEGVR